MKLVVTALCLFWLNICSASSWEDWDDKTKAMFVASNIAIIADWGTTRDIAKRPNEYKEVGPIAQRFIGEHPSVDGVNVYMIARLLINYLVAVNVDDSDYRFAYLTFTTVGHGMAAHHNMKLGLRFNF